MQDQPIHTMMVPTELKDGTTIWVQARMISGDERIVPSLAPFSQLTGAVESIAKSIVTTLQKVKPRRASVEFGLEIGVDSGKLTALLVKGTGTANLKITLEWEEMPGDAK